MTGTFHGSFTTGRNGELCTYTAPELRLVPTIVRSTVTTNEFAPPRLTRSHGVVVPADVEVVGLLLTPATKPCDGMASDEVSKTSAPGDVTRIGDALGATLTGTVIEPSGKRS